MQDLSGFSVPKGFRGGNAIKVQLWWAVQATLFALCHRNALVHGVVDTVIWLADKA